jgi:hypothetical protein
VRVSKLIPLRGDNALQFSIEYEHNFADDAIGPEDTLRITAKILFPR